MKSSNPMLNEKSLRVNANKDGKVATIGGTIAKTIALLTITAVAAALSWTSSTKTGEFSGLLFPASIIGLVLGFVTIFKAHLSPITAPIYAVCQGIVLGGLSSYFEGMYPGIATSAVLSTFTVFFLMLFLYQANIIKVTDRFRSILISAMMGIMFVYLISFVLSFFNPQLSIFNQGGMVGLLFTGFVIFIASFSLMLDFDTIEKVKTFSMPQYMEWYCAFGLIITLIWLYIEILRFLSILRNQD